MICVIPTTKERLPNQLSAEEARRLLEENLNPDLRKCGTLPGCRRCGIKAGVDVLEMAERVVQNRSQVGELA